MRKSILVLLMCAVVPTHAKAASIQLESQTGLMSPEASITFDEIILANSTLLTDQYAALGVTFTAGILYNPGTATMDDSIMGLDGRRLANFYPPSSVFSIQFVDPVAEAAVGLLAPDITTFTALLGGVEVEMFQNTRTPQAQGFYGFSGIVFDEIRIDAHSRFDEGRAVLDNVQFTRAPPIPEPSSALVFGLGLMLISRARRCRAN